MQTFHEKEGQEGGRRQFTEEAFIQVRTPCQYQDINGKCKICACQHIDYSGRALLMVYRYPQNTSSTCSSAKSGGWDRTALSSLVFKLEITCLLNLWKVLVTKEGKKNHSPHLWNLHLQPWLMLLYVRKNKLGASWHWSRAEGRFNLSYICKYSGEEISLHLILGSACLLPPVN